MGKKNYGRGVSLGEFVSFHRDVTVNEMDGAGHIWFELLLGFGAWE